MENLTTEEAEYLGETTYVENFASYIKAFKDDARLVNIAGHARWVVTENGVERIVRPIETKDDE